MVRHRVVARREQRGRQLSLRREFARAERVDPRVPADQGAAGDATAHGTVRQALREELTRARQPEMCWGCGRNRACRERFLLHPPILDPRPERNKTRFPQNGAKSRTGGHTILCEVIKVDVWSDIACPWCYIGKRKFEAGAEAFDGEVEVTYHSFELAPDT